MSKPVHSNDEQALGDQLRREAEATRPAFSETLHEQIWHAVQECKTLSAGAQRRDARTPRSRRWGLAAAISASLLVILFAWQAADKQTKLSSAVTNGTAAEKPLGSAEVEEDTDLERVAELTGGATETVDTWLDATLTEHRWAYLDHDAKAILEAITSGLPFGLASIESSEEPTANSQSARSID